MLNEKLIVISRAGGPPALPKNRMVRAGTKPAAQKDGHGPAGI
jgi:hypothetical protein